MQNHMQMIILKIRKINDCCLIVNIAGKIIELKTSIRKKNLVFFSNSFFITKFVYQLVHLCLNSALEKL
jgi:hypothetical protein